MPCHHNLGGHLTAYLDDAGLRSDPKGPLFRTIGRGTGKSTRTVLVPQPLIVKSRRKNHPGGKVPANTRKRFGKSLGAGKVPDIDGPRP